MTDPYSVLGISSNATDDEVKTAYRNLARKYHPDNYQGNPLSDLAGEKMKEINQAYDEIMNTRRGGGGQNGGGSTSAGGQGGSSYASGYGGGAGTSQFADVRRLINSGRVTQAEELLDGIPRGSRDAEWHFLKGTVQYTRGWLDDAYMNFARACEMDPGNGEYRAAMSQLEWQRKTGRAPGYQQTAGYGQGCSVCDCCTAYMCCQFCCPR